MKKIDMIIFDMDGTLWDTIDVSTEAANIIAKNYNEVKKASPSLLRSIMGMGLEDVAKTMMPYLELKKAIYYAKLRIDLTNELLNKKGGKIYKGVIKTIKELSKKYKLGIVTNSFDKYAEIFIRSYGLEKYFTDYIGTASYGITKAQAIKEMMKRNSVSSSCYVGDIKNDMLNAQEANSVFIHAKYGFDPSLKSDLYINKFSDLKELLEK